MPKQPKKEFADKAAPLNAQEQVQMSMHIATEMAEAFPGMERVSAQVGGVKITLKRKP